MLSDLKNTKYKIISPLIQPDTQRDAIQLGTTISEGFSHCKNTSMTMLFNWLGQNYEPLKDYAHIGEYTYNALLVSFMVSGEKIQSWNCHAKFLSHTLTSNKIPLKANFVNFRANYTEILFSLLQGFPIVLGTIITASGHIVLLVGLTANGDFIIIDPFGEPPNYKNKKADYYVIPKTQFNQYINASCNCIFLQDVVA